MSEFPKLDESRNLPSTYQEVLKIRKYINDELVPFLSILKNAFFGGDGGDLDIGNGDVIVDENGDARVPGITVVVNNIYVDTKPSDYDRDLTFEIKDRDTLDLPLTDTLPDSVIQKYVTLMTTRIKQEIVMPDGTTKVTYPAWQIAYGDEGGHLFLYYRKSDENDNWGPWNKVFDLEVMLELNPEIVDKLSHRQIVESDVLPQTQEPGDYWFWPIQKGVDPVASGSGIADIEDIPQPDIPDGYYFQSLDDPNERFDLPEDNARYVYVDIVTGNFIIPKYPDEKELMVGVDDPDPDYFGYYAVDLDNPGTIIYLPEEEWEFYRMMIINPLRDDKDGKPIDQLDPDNNGTWDGHDPNRPDVKDGEGPGTPNPDAGTAGEDYDLDPDGQKHGDWADPLPDDLWDVDKNEPIDPILVAYKNYWLIDPAGVVEDVQFVRKELERYMTFVLPGGMLMDPTNAKDTILTDLGSTPDPEPPKDPDFTMTDIDTGKTDELTKDELDKLGTYDAAGGSQVTPSGTENISIVDI